MQAAERFLEDGLQFGGPKLVEDGRALPQRRDKFAWQLIAEYVFRGGEGFGGKFADRGVQEREALAGAQANAAGARSLGADVAALDDVQHPFIARSRIDDDGADRKIG